MYLMLKLRIMTLTVLLSGLFTSQFALSADLHSMVKAKNYVAVQKALSRAKINTEQRDSNGDTPVLIAARHGDLKMLKILVKHGANINALDTKRRDVLNIAISTQNVALARTALKLGADATMKTSIYDGSALIYGSDRGAVEIVEMLIKAGAPVNRINNLGWTALLEVAILGDGSAPYVKITQMLLKAGADKNIADKDGMTPLDHAKKRGHTNLVKILSQ